jgi:hypothetical protein
MGTTVSTTIKVLNEPNKVGLIMKNLARLIIRVLLTGLENVGTAEAYRLGIDLKESQKKK